MTVRLAVLAILLYVAADFANPLMPGAVCFDPDESVDGLGRTTRASALAAPAPAAAGSVAAVPPGPPPLVSVHALPYSDARAARPAPRARAALPIVSDRAADDA